MLMMVSVTMRLRVGLWKNKYSLNPSGSLTNAVIGTLLEAKVRQITTDAALELARLIRNDV
jgi:hypothetical protein